MKRFAAKLLLLLGGLVFGCVAAEIVLRVMGYSYPIFYQTDRVRGYAPIPNVEGWFWVENKTYVKINSVGFRDREHVVAKPANTFRIAVLGDSFAEARQVPMEAAFWSVMERKLNECGGFGGKNVEVLNFGVGGYGTVEELQTLRQRVWAYSPDLVLLTFTTFNDIADNYRPFKGAEEIPYFTLNDGRLILDDSFLNSPKYQKLDSAMFNAWITVHNHSRFIQLAHHAQFAFRTKMSGLKEARRLAELQKERDSVPREQQPMTTASLSDLLGIQNMIYKEPDNPDWNAAWQLTEALVTQVREDVGEHGAKFMLATITTDIQTYPDPQVRRSLMDQIGVSDLFYPDRRLEALASRQGMDFLDLAQPMQSYADTTGTFLHGFDDQLGSGHWNEAGHKLAGELISQRLCQVGLP
ncbi:MAG: SGNH/GDSL hydrolase family protein [Pyrinomonadaceae bacterium]